MADRHLPANAVCAAHTLGETIIALDWILYEENTQMAGSLKMVNGVYGIHFFEIELLQPAGSVSFRFILSNHAGEIGALELTLNIVVSLRTSVNFVISHLTFLLFRHHEEA